MARTNYDRGYEVERKAMTQLAGRGEIVVRTAGSHGPWDVIAVDPAERTMRFIQCKRQRVKRSAPKQCFPGDGPYAVRFETWTWVDRRGFEVTSNG